MSGLIDQAISHITKQMMDADDPAINAIEEYLTNVCNTEAVANKLLASDKTLKGAYETLRKTAENRLKSRSGTQCVAISPDEAPSIIEKYYGITEDDKTTRKTVGVPNLTAAGAGQVVNILDLI